MFGEGSGVYLDTVFADIRWLPIGAKQGLKHFRLYHQPLTLALVELLLLAEATGWIDSCRVTILFSRYTFMFSFSWKCSCGWELEAADLFSFNHQGTFTRQLEKYNRQVGWEGKFLIIVDTEETFRRQREFFRFKQKKIYQVGQVEKSKESKPCELFVCF